MGKIVQQSANAGSVMSFELLKTKDKIPDVLKLIQELESKKILVGIPEQEAGRKEGPLNNAEIAFLNSEGVRSGQMRSEMNASGGSYNDALNAYIHSHGEPRFNVPPRPFLIPAINSIRYDLAVRMGRAFKRVVSGNPIEAELDKIGLFAQSTVKKWFTDPRNNWPPNAPYTIAKKGSDKPMIDTGQLRNAINYVIRPSK